MARVTIEDCVEKVGSHFRVVQVAAHRAHQIELGASPKVERENDKSVVIALREIAEDKIDETILSKPLAEKESWEQEEGLLVQPDDLGQAIADTDNYSDMNETEDDNAESVKKADDSKATDSTIAEDDSADISQLLNSDVDEAPKTSET